MTRCAALLALLLVACGTTSTPATGDAGCETERPCTVDEDCADLGPYGYCRTWEPGEPGLCVID